MTKTELFDTVVAVNSVWNPENPEPWVAVPLSLICKLLADATDTQTVSPQTIQNMERSGFDWHGQKVVLVSEAANRMGAATEGAIETYQKEKVAAKADYPCTPEMTAGEFPNRHFTIPENEKGER